uniref:Uncharacterized protein n=1 Tax=Anopheles stephensi TaxID=30069 RepID=A0A182Y369_ANOST
MIIRLKKSDAQVCCMIEHSFPQEPFLECYERHKTSSMNNETIMCIHQCYYEAIGFFSKDEQIQSDKYLTYRDSLDSEKHQTSFTFALKACAQIALDIIKHFAKVEKKPRCSPIPYLFNRCLMEVDIVNCPSDRWIDC